MEYGRPIPLHTPAEDDGRETLKTGTPAFAAHGDGFVFVETSWKAVPAETRDQLRSFQLWLKRDLGIHFDLSFFREERDPIFSRAHMRLERLRRYASPHGSPKAQQDRVPWAGQISTQRPEFVRIDVDRPVESMLRTLAHESRHAWQFQNRSEFIELLLRNVSQAALDDREALVDFCEQDAQRYAEKAVGRWREGHS